MTTKTIEDLYASLFDTIDRVKSGTMEPEKARVISDLSQVIVNTAKVQVDYRRVADQAEARFLTLPAAEPAALPNGITGIRRHILKGD
jgi:hypothetical protein